MAILINPDTGILTLSVGDLLQEEITFKIGFSGAMSLRRMWVGQGIHQVYQEECMGRIPSYRREVPIMYTFQAAGLTVILQGRIDGLFVDSDGVTILEEVKSLHFGRDLDRVYRGALGEVYRRQVALYGWMWSRVKGDPVACRLVLVDITTGERRIEEVRPDFDQVASFVRGRIVRLVRTWEKAKRERDRKSRASESISFPHPTFRPYQESMTRNVRTALEEGRHLLIEAPTGIGKTAAAIHPTVVFALKQGLKVFFLTAKTLQQDMAVQTLKAMNREGSFRSLRLRAKARMCANSEIICHEDFCPYARNYAEKVHTHGTVDKLLAAFSHLDPDTIYSAAVSDEVCPFEISLDLTKHTDAIVCDYNYIFEPSVSLKDTREGLGLTDTVVIVDEAHNLVDRSREYYSPSISSTLIRQASAFLTFMASDIAEILRGILQSLEEKLTAWANHQFDPGETEKPCGPPDIDLPEYLLQIEGQILEYITEVHERGTRRGEDPLLELYFRLSRMVMLHREDYEEFTWTLRRTGDSVELKLFCLDASRFLGAIVDQTWSTVAMSATLQPFEFYESLIGFAHDRTDREAYPSPFPRENRLILVVPTLNTTYRHRTRSIGKLVTLLHDMAGRVKGNSLILLPSYAYLDMVRGNWPSGGNRLLVQKAEMAPDAREDIIRELRAVKEPLVLLAVAGGIYAEGIDYPGEMLRGVFIVSPSLPQVGLEQNLLKEHYERRYERGFSYAYLIPGMRRVIQAAGRLIRSEEDRGVIALICERFTDSRYTRFFPEYWYESSPDELVEENPITTMETFFGESHET
ncbi:MAG TPA: ATP-dependent DNA helicase [Thermoanaerobaculia bacterium]|nr:ATP-dependent DNA helicase [Thermoanaerobaculia bacterium]HUM29577.1 ATP-dependent DNA helicase [Thermoanaerobaculia bacterium]HXK67960.1 ATP-dependent DNA helicase [Thermoanaerobaculia bacterium]